MIAKIIDEYTDRADLSYYQKWKLRNPDKYEKIWKNSNKRTYSKLTEEQRELKRAKERDRFASLPVEKKKERYLRKNYGISYGEYLDLGNSQDWRCATCGRDVTSDTSVSSSDVACVDHDHNSGKVRGILCNHCNRALGLLKEDKTTLNNLIKYLEIHGG